MTNHPIWRYENQMPPGREFEIYHATNTVLQPTIYQSHYYFEIYFLLRGTIRVIADEQDICPVLGEAIIYPPGCMHRVMHTDAALAYERFYIYLSREFLQSISTEDYRFISILEGLTKEGNHSFKLGDKVVLDLARTADEIIEAALDTTPAGVLSNRCRMTMYLIRLLGLLEESVATTADSASCRMNDLIRYINQHAGQPLSLDHLEEAFGISKYVLLHEFKDYTGMPIYQYILTRRVILAQQLIEQGASPRQAYEQSGFSNYTSFYRAFKARTGKSPNQYGKAL